MVWTAERRRASNRHFFFWYPITLLPPLIAIVAALVTADTDWLLAPIAFTVAWEYLCLWWAGDFDPERIAKHGG